MVYNEHVKHNVLRTPYSVLTSMKVETGSKLGEFLGDMFSALLKKNVNKMKSLLFFYGKFPFFVFN